MLYTPGTKVLLRHTGEMATVVSRLEDEVLLIRLEEDPDITIPAYEEDLLPAAAATSHVPSPIHQAKEQRAQERRRRLKGAERISAPKGISAVFEPMPGRDGTVLRYTVWLLNDTEQECLFELHIETRTRRVVHTEDKLEALAAVECGVMLADDLSDLPEVHLVCRRISTVGVEPPLERTVRLRPKTFFNSLQAVPVLGVTAYRFVLFEHLSAAVPSKPPTDLRQYVRQQVPRTEKKPSLPLRPVDPYDVKAAAEFSHEIDLHAERLLPHAARLDRSQILHLQLAHLRAFLEKAIRLGIPRVFVIHGVGEGILRRAVADELRRHPGVWKFKNEYHHKYGYGATEVIFY